MEIFFDDLESGEGGWTHGTNCLGVGCDPEDDWQLGAMLHGDADCLARRKKLITSKKWLKNCVTRQKKESPRR